MRSKSSAGTWLLGAEHTPKEFFEQVAEYQPNVAVISSNLEGDPQGGVKVVRELRASAPSTRSILLLDCSCPLPKPHGLHQTSSGQMEAI